MDVIRRLKMTYNIMKGPMTIENRINKLEENICIDVNMAEESGWAAYLPYIKDNVNELTVLKKALKIRDKRKNIENNEF